MAYHTLGNIAVRIIEIFRESPGRDFSAIELAQRCHVSVGTVHNAMSEIRAMGLYPQSVRVYRLTLTTQEKLRTPTTEETS